MNEEWEFSRKQGTDALLGWGNMCSLAAVSVPSITFLLLPASRVIKNPPVNAGDTGSIPDPGRSHMPQDS